MSERVLKSNEKPFSLSWGSHLMQRSWKACCHRRGWLHRFGVAAQVAEQRVSRSAAGLLVFGTQSIAVC